MSILQDLAIEDLTPGLPTENTPDKPTPKSEPDIQRPVIVPVNVPEIKPNAFINGTVSPVEYSLSGAIYEMSAYIPLIAYLYSAPANTQVRINIYSPGGSVATASAIANAIMQSRAHVTTVNMGLAASAAAFLLCCGDTIIIEPNAFTMFHMSSHLDWGNSEDILDKAKSIITYVDNKLLGIGVRRGLLMEDEVNAVIHKRRDCWVGAPEMIKRCEAWNARSSREVK